MVEIFKKIAFFDKTGVDYNEVLLYVKNIIRLGNPTLMITLHTAVRKYRNYKNMGGFIYNEFKKNKLNVMDEEAFLNKYSFLAQRYEYT